jgi:HEAT repeat protein
MGIFNRKPRVKALARAGDVDGLIAASRYRQPASTQDGEVIDLGIRTRVSAICALRDLKPEAGREAVVEALSDPSDRVRTAAIVVLFEREQADPIADALRWLPEEGNSRYLAVRALLELGKPGSARVVADALVHQHGEGPIAEDEMPALEELLEADVRRVASDDVLNLLAGAIREDDDLVADRAVQLLVRMAPASVEVLLSALEDDRAGHRAAVALAQIKDIRALEPLIEALEHDDPRARAASCATLGELRSPVAVEPLLRATQDPEIEVRARAGSALDQLGTVAVVVGISAILRPEIANALEAGPAAAPELEPATEGSDPHNGRAVTSATTLERVARLLEAWGPPASRASTDAGAPAGSGAGAIENPGRFTDHD